jgi:hypothetical protein
MPAPQTVDNWWTDTSSCFIPGEAFPVYPYNYKAVDVCGGATAITTHPLLDSAGNSYGTIYFFRNFFNRLLVTVALDGSPDGQWFLQVPSNGASSLLACPLRFLPTSYPSPMLLTFPLPPLHVGFNSSLPGDATAIHLSIGDSDTALKGSLAAGRIPYRGPIQPGLFTCFTLGVSLVWMMCVCQGVNVCLGKGRGGDTGHVWVSGCGDTAHTHTHTAHSTHAGARTHDE